MANDPQGVVTFSGIEAELSASITLSHGITPSTPALYMPSVPKSLPETGTLRITFAGISHDFPDCRVTKVEEDVARDGKQTFAIHLLDHRWRWKYPTISGHYNVTIGDLSKEIRPETAKTMRELMKLCADAMDEPKFDFSRVPDKLFPEVQWEYTNAAQALQELCDQCGCRIVMASGNKFSVQVAGKGSNLPNDDTVVEESVSYERNEAPDAILFVAGRTAYDHDFELEAVGKDKGGKVVPIDKLSYKPRDGWQKSEPILFEKVAADAGDKMRDFAKESIFRWYRIKLPVTIPGVVGPIKKLAQLLPLLGIQVTKAKFFQADGTERVQNLPAWVYGQYYQDTAGEKPNMDRITGDADHFPETLYQRDFNIDQERGVIVFSDPVYRFIQSKTIIDGISYDNNDIAPPKLFIRMAVNLRDEDTRAYEHYTVERKLPGKELKTKPYILRRDDIRLEFYKHPTLVLARANNKAQVDAEAKLYLDAKQAEFDLQTPGTRVYAGIKNIQPDGAIQQVTWYIDTTGFAFTRISRNKEESLIVPSFEQRRLFEQIGAALKLKVPGAVEPKKGEGLK